MIHTKLSVLQQIQYWLILMICLLTFFKYQASRSSIKAARRVSLTPLETGINLAYVTCKIK